MIRVIGVRQESGGYFLCIVVSSLLCNGKREILRFCIANGLGWVKFKEGYLRGFVSVPLWHAKVGETSVPRPLCSRC